MKRYLVKRVVYFPQDARVEVFDFSKESDETEQTQLVKELMQNTVTEDTAWLCQTDETRFIVEEGRGIIGMYRENYDQVRFEDIPQPVYGRLCEDDEMKAMVLKALNDNIHTLASLPRSFIMVKNSKGERKVVCFSDFQEHNK